MNAKYTIFQLYYFSDTISIRVLYNSLNWKRHIFYLEIIATLIFKESLILSTKTFLYFIFISQVKSEPFTNGLREVRGYSSSLNFSGQVLDSATWFQPWLFCLLSGYLPTYKRKIVAVTYNFHS